MKDFEFIGIQGTDLPAVLAKLKAEIIRKYANIDFEVKYVSVLPGYTVNPLTNQMVTTFMAVGHVEFEKGGIDTRPGRIELPK